VTDLKQNQTQPSTGAARGKIARSPNRILSALPDDEYQRLKPDLKPVVVEHRQVLYKMGAPVREVYFPHGGVFSITTVLSDGSVVESATAGNEGMVGIEAFVRAGATAYGETMLQVPGGNAEKLSVIALRRELIKGGVLAELLGRYLETVIGHAMQTVACNTLHNVQERCCRWLLMTHDRMPGDEFLLSHELLAMMLGARRQSVTVVARVLQSAGLIRYRHGRITVLDRAGLEAGACECYRVLRTQFDRLFS
jgi:CRP-like cAMP-binding protein